MGFRAFLSNWYGKFISSTCPHHRRGFYRFRDRAIHDYYQIDLQVAWGTILHDLDPVTAAVKAYLGD